MIFPWDASVAETGPGQASQGQKVYRRAKSLAQVAPWLHIQRLRLPAQDTLHLRMQRALLVLHPRGESELVRCEECSHLYKSVDPLLNELLPELRSMINKGLQICGTELVRTQQLIGDFITRGMELLPEGLESRAMLRHDLLHLGLLVIREPHLAEQPDDEPVAIPSSTPVSHPVVLGIAPCRPQGDHNDAK